ncbi:hypothetical protein INR49_007826 [Caranx melampygus]|nr:hypothetical protein INR49_007826 [Caranx melampygus]
MVEIFSYDDTGASSYAQTAPKCIITSARDTRWDDPVRQDTPSSSCTCQRALIANYIAVGPNRRI